MTEHTHALWAYYYYTRHMFAIFVSPHIVQIALSNRMEAAASTSSFLQQYLVFSNNIWSSLPTKCQLSANLAPLQVTKAPKSTQKGNLGYLDFWSFHIPLSSFYVWQLKK